MIKNIIEKIKSFFSRKVDALSVDMLGIKRSGKWRNTRQKHLQSEPTCAACGGTKNLQVHHCVPIHVDGNKELDQDNLITLCEENKCHFIFGHFYNWSSFNINVRKDAEAMLKKIKERP